MRPPWNIVRTIRKELKFLPHLLRLRVLLQRTDEETLSDETVDVHLVRDSFLDGNSIGITVGLNLRLIFGLDIRVIFGLKIPGGKRAVVSLY